MDTKQEIEGYLALSDWRVKENANTSYSVAGLQLHLAEKAIKEYTLNHIYTPEIREAYVNNYIHIHDLGLSITCYCMGHDLRKLLVEGFNGIAGKVASSPPKRLRTALNQMVNYLFTNQAENAGAQAFSNFDTLLAPFVKKDKLEYSEVKQCIQEFVYSTNVPTRVGFQSIFANVTFDLKCPAMFKNDRPIIHGKQCDFTYGDCNQEIGMIAKAFFEVMMMGDFEGKPFTFPIPTINLHKDFVWDDDVARVIFEATARFGTPTFQNFINSDLSPESSYAMCCRLSIKKSELQRKSGGVFGAGVSTGSIGVVSLNLPRIAYESKNEQELLMNLDKYCDIAKQSLEIKRAVINTNLKNGLMPYTKRYIGHYNNHFSTIALVGGNEMCLNLIKKDITTDEGQDLMERVLIHLKNKIQSYQDETSNFYNLEQAPAESTSYKFAKKDKLTYSDIITAGEKVQYYNNSTHAPVNHQLQLMRMIKIQERFNKHYNGGTIVHVFLGQKMTDWINCMLLVKKIAEKTTLPFFDITPNFSFCPIHGYISGTHALCPLTHTKEDIDKFGIETGDKI